MSELCQCCGSMGEDRRTLWMACFYAMDELPIPFEKQVLFHADLETLEKVSDPVRFPNTPVVLQSGTARSSGELTPRQFFTLRVCKRCRSEWLEAIRRWFQAIPEGEDHDADDDKPSSVGSGIFIRENGAVKEITREEWDRREREKKGRSAK